MVVVRVASPATDQELTWIELACSLRREGNIGLSGCCSLVMWGGIGEQGGISEEHNLRLDR